MALPKAPTARVMAMTDYDEVMALWRASEGLLLNESDEPGPIATFLERNPGLSQVLRLDGRVIGAVLCGHDGRRGYLHHLAVAAEQRGRGWGRLLVERCRACLAAAGIRKCNIIVDADNAAGLGFWQAQGYVAHDGLQFLQRPTG